MGDKVKAAGQAELLMSSNDLSADMVFFEKLGFRLDQIYPSDDPEVARMSGAGMRIRLDRSADLPPTVIHMLGDEAGDTELTAPNGTIIRFMPASFDLHLPATQHRFETRRLRDSAPWVIGRAGMLYRDLIPDRLGGSIIASHIRIPDAGPVPDVVHYHTIGFQLIYCYKGWVRLVYEDQGPPFILKAGDCVTQPPEIRHRVLEASENLEVVEIGVPAEHMTTVDHDMELPTPHYRPEREFGGQLFCHHQADQVAWKSYGKSGLVSKQTGINIATKGTADVQVLKPEDGHDVVSGLNHRADIHFTFVLEGSFELTASGHDQQLLKAGDALVIPPDLEYSFKSMSSDLELLQVVLP